MGLYCHRQLTISFVVMAILLLASVSAITPFNPTRQFSIGSRKIMAERRLSGPGSIRPLCRSKCGKCAPCEPVLVPIQPGMKMSIDYYPEVWRCKCGNKLFMP
ncbi:hypothetical protein CASFOL_005414 [Castilleja foliolosa]|uniref:Epidermal patterning factor-like protein n=1 Tax=Castilleja foliolosa TaxID=1961234 RepID=A0ABD3E3F1_9LAMI